MIEITDEMIDTAIDGGFRRNVGAWDAAGAVRAIIPLIRAAVLDEAQRAIEAKGLKLVPQEPTDEMLEAADRAHRSHEHHALIAAAPVITLKDIVP